MLWSQTRLTWFPSAGFPIAWAGLPPGSGQSGLTAAAGRATGVLANLGSGSTERSRPRTEMRSPGRRVFFSSNSPHALVVSDAAAAATNCRRFIDTDRRSRLQRGSHFSGSAANTLGRALIVRELLVDIERGGLVAGLKLGRGG